MCLTLQWASLSLKMQVWSSVLGSVWSPSSQQGVSPTKACCRCRQEPITVPQPLGCRSSWALVSTDCLIWPFMLPGCSYIIFFHFRCLISNGHHVCGVPSYRPLPAEGKLTSHGRAPPHLLLSSAFQVNTGFSEPPSSALHQACF